MYSGWLCGSRERSMISTIVKPLLAKMFCSDKPSRMRVALSATAGILSALALLLVKETVFLFVGVPTGIRAIELANKSTCSIVTCPQPQVADLDFEFPFLCGLGTGVMVELGDPSSFAFRFRRVRLKHCEDVRTERCKVAQSRISDGRVVSW